LPRGQRQLRRRPEPLPRGDRGPDRPTGRGATRLVTRVTSRAPRRAETDRAPWRGASMLRDPRYDRSRLIEAAARAVATRRLARAIALYRWVLAFEPTNAEIHLKLAPLLARRRSRFDAWKSYQAAARACASQGHADRALAIYRQAATALPREI